MGWHDLAFYDPVLYESLRQLLVDAEKEDADTIFAALELSFCIQLSKEEGGGQVELMPQGGETRVNPANVYAYVRQYAEHRMLTVAQKALSVSHISNFVPLMTR